MNEYTDLLCRLVECRPVSSDVTAVNRAETMMLDFLEAHGICCEMEEWEGRKVLYASTRPGRVQDVLLNAHLDVVPAIEESQFTPRIADGWLHARGAGDCLGNAVCIARFLCENRDAFRAGALFTADEEIGGETTRVMAERGCGALKAVLILDGGGEEGILCAQKGILVLKMTARSHGGHSSVPWEFANPIDLLTEAYGKLRAEWRNPVSADDWRNSMAPCMISGGFAENQIPDTAEMILNFRYVADDDSRKILDFVKSAGLEVSVQRICPPVSSDPDSPALRFLRQAWESVAGRPVKFTRMCAATDARHLKSLNVPIAIAGCVCTGMHSSEEKLLLSSIDAWQRILREYMTLLCGNPRAV